jgi:hypothetical protein
MSATMPSGLSRLTKIKLTEADCSNVRWEVVETTDVYRRSVGRGTHPVTGLPIEVMRTEFLEDEHLQKLNAEERASRDAKPWSAGVGSDKGGNMPMVRVGRIPTNKLFAELAPKMREGDKDHLKWWLNREQNQVFRTRSGKL